MGLNSIFAWKGEFIQAAAEDNLSIAKIEISTLIRITDAAKFLSQMNHLTPLVLGRFLVVEIQASGDVASRPAQSRAIRASGIWLAPWSGTRTARSFRPRRRRSVLFGRENIGALGRRKDRIVGDSPRSSLNAVAAAGASRAARFDRLQRSSAPPEFFACGAGPT